MPVIAYNLCQDDARLRRLAGPTVHFLGWTSPEELRSAYAACRAFVFTAEAEFKAFVERNLDAGRQK